MNEWLTSHHLIDESNFGKEDLLHWTEVVLIKVIRCKGLLQERNQANNKPDIMISLYIYRYHQLVIACFETWRRRMQFGMNVLIRGEYGLPGG